MESEQKKTGVGVKQVRAVKPALIVSEYTVSEYSTSLGSLLGALEDNSMPAALICSASCNVEAIVNENIEVFRHPAIELPFMGRQNRNMLLEKLRKFDTLGYDLIAMVADDGVCVGAEVFSVTNTLDVPNLKSEMVKGLMAGLKKAALEQKIVIPGGELAELGDALNGAVWNATAVGLVEKDRVITGADIEEGDAVLAFKSAGIRSNGLSLARMILKEKFGDDWVNQDFDGRSWGEVILTPSKIYHRAVLNLIGGYKQERKFNIKGLVHNTGGGIKGNLPRLLKKKGLGADLTDLPQPHEFMKKLQELGNVSGEEAYKTWNMGVGMMAIVDSSDADSVVEALKDEGVEAVVAGKVTAGPDIKLSI